MFTLSFDIFVFNLWVFRSCDYSVAESVPIVGLGHPEPEHHLAGMRITPFAIHAINKETKAFRVQSVSEPIEQPLTERWSNVVCAISK